MSTNWDQAAKQMQPAFKNGAPGLSMGAGAMPFAPGATQYRPQTQPMSTPVQPAAPELPQGSGGAAPQQQQPSGGGGQQQPMMGQPIPGMEQTIAYARALLERMRAQLAASRQQGRGGIGGPPGRMF